MAQRTPACGEPRARGRHLLPAMRPIAPQNSTTEGLKGPLVRQPAPHGVTYTLTHKGFGEGWAGDGRGLKKAGPLIIHD